MTTREIVATFKMYDSDVKCAHADILSHRRRKRAGREWQNRQMDTRCIPLFI